MCSSESTPSYGLNAVRTFVRLMSGTAVLQPAHTEAGPSPAILLPAMRRRALLADRQHARRASPAHAIRCAEVAAGWRAALPERGLCPLCLSAMSDHNDSVPTLLPSCLHAVCRGCTVNEAANGALDCPTCGVVSPLPADGALPVHPFYGSSSAGSSMRPLQALLGDAERARAVAAEHVGHAADARVTTADVLARRRVVQLHINATFDGVVRRLRAQQRALLGELAEQTAEARTALAAVDDAERVRWRPVRDSIAFCAAAPPTSLALAQARIEAAGATVPVFPVLHGPRFQFHLEPAVEPSLVHFGNIKKT